MLPDKKQHVLIVDDTTMNLKILTDLLSEKYDISTAKDGNTAIKLAKVTQPDLILLDIIMPIMDGFEVCSMLKSIDETKDIPVIFISALSDAIDEEKGFEIGAVDYITKPFNASVVKARVNNHLRLNMAMKELKRLYNMALDSNPLTGLPGNNSIALRIERALDEKEELCVIYADLDNFKPYNDIYGFAMGDKVIKFTANTLASIVDNIDNEKCFMGHIGGDDFVLLVPSDKIAEVTNNIIEIFDRDIKQFYLEEDIKRGYITCLNRQGCEQKFPVVSISMAGVDLKNTGYKKYLQVNDICAVLKKKAKSENGSCFCLERRKYTSDNGIFCR